MSFFSVDAYSPNQLSEEAFEESFRCAIMEHVGVELWEDLKDAPTAWLTSLYPEIRLLGFGAQDIINVVNEMKTIKASSRNETLLAEAQSMEDSYKPWLALPVTTRDFVYASSGLYCFDLPITYLRRNGKELNNELTSSGVVLTSLRALQFRHLIDNPAFPFNQMNYDAMTNAVRSIWGPIHPDDVDLRSGF